MNTSTKIILGAVILALAFILTYKAINQEPSESLPKHMQVTAIMENSGCILCHNTQPKMPFYANWPLKEGTMPPLSFTIFRLGSAVKSREAEIVREWAMENGYIVRTKED